MNKQKVLVKTAAAFFLFACASYADRVADESHDRDKPGTAEEMVPLSPEATNEISGYFRQIGASPLKIVFAMNNEGIVVHFRPDNVELPEIKFPLQVGKLLEPPEVITIIHTSDASKQARICHYDAAGRYHCH